MDEIKGIFFSDLDKVRKYRKLDYKLFCISIIPVFILMALSMAEIFSNKYVSAVFGLFMVFTILFYLLFRLEGLLLLSEHRKKKILESYKCMRSGCKTSLGSCIYVAEWGISICIYLDHEFKGNIEKLIEKSKIDV